MIPLSEAVKRTGKSRQAIRKSIGNGKVRGERDQSGRWVVDPASLFAYYNPVAENSSNHSNHVAPPLQAELDGLKRELEQVKDERDDLRRRLDRSEEERREKDRQLMALLTDQRERPGFWFRLFGK